MSARRAAIRHCESANNRDRVGSTVSKEGNLPGDNLPSVSTNMGSSNCIMPGDIGGSTIQTDDSELTQERLTDPYTYGAPPQVEHQMQRELKYFFMNPYEKFKARSRKPWKLGIQIFKIVLVTAQLVLFGTNQFSVVTFMEENGKAFEHIFLKEWQSTYDSGVYPSTKSLYALYEVDSFFEHADHVIVQYSNLNDIALGTYNVASDRNVWVHIEEYEKFDVEDGYYELNLKTHKYNFNVNITDNMTGFHLKDFLVKEHNHSIKIDRLETMDLKFSIQSVHVQDDKTLSPPDCITFDVKVLFDNRPHSGRVSVQLFDEHNVDRNCTQVTRDKAKDDDAVFWRAGVTLMDIFIMVLCVVSSILCSRSLIKGYHLRKKTSKFFGRYYQRKLSRSERMEFVNLWYVMIILSDIFTLSGTITKILIQEQLWTDYDSCSLLLGAGCFLVWFGILRYLGFFHSYSIPVITLKCAMPNVLRFLLCAAIMYLAYAFCGWVVLGPYHKKFRTMGISIECMFSLINGDDMFATFRAMSDTNPLIYYFSRLYLYTFISLFIYVVLSLFIAVIMDTYETVKEFRDRGECENDLQIFIKQCEESPDSGCFKVTTESTGKGFFNRCCKKKTNRPDEYTPLMD